MCEDKYNMSFLMLFTIQKTYRGYQSKSFKGDEKHTNTFDFCFCSRYRYRMIDARTIRVCVIYHDKCGNLKEKRAIRIRCGENQFTLLLMVKEIPRSRSSYTLRIRCVDFASSSESHLILSMRASMVFLAAAPTKLSFYTTMAYQCIPPFVLCDARFSVASRSIAGTNCSFAWRATSTGNDGIQFAVVIRSSATARMPDRYRRRFNLAALALSRRARARARGKLTTTVRKIDRRRW